MKIKRILALALFTLAVAATSHATLTPLPCFQLCARIACIPEDTCGPYVNSQGQSVCGCHPRNI